MSKVSKPALPGLIGELFLDVDDAMSRQTQADTPVNRRGLVRTLIAAVEGLAWLYREDVMAAAETMGLISENERRALSETTYFVSEDGKISEQRRFISTTAMVRLTARLAAKCALGGQPNFGVEGWANLKQTIQLRNRITHPKAVTDLTVSAEDITRARSAFFWFSELMVSEMARTNDTLRDYSKRLGDVIRLLEVGDEAALTLYRRLQEGD